MSDDTAITTWRVTCRVAEAERPGILARFTHIFAERSISLREVHAQYRDGEPEIVADFTASEVTVRYLRRRLLRHPQIVAVELQPTRCGTEQ